MDSQQVLIASSFIIPLIIAITLHEAAHAFAANALGDATAKLKGRLSLNPFRHVDPVGTILLPGMLILANSPIRFGWAKPVPVNFRNLRSLRRDMALVAFAGPAMNFLLAFISALLLHLDKVVPPERAPWLYMNLVNSVGVNAVLAVFNLLPLLPLDGGRILNAALPRKLAAAHARTERYGLVFVLLLFMLPALLQNAGMPDFPIGNYLIGIPANAAGDLILHLAGIGDAGNG